MATESPARQLGQSFRSRRNTSFSRWWARSSPGKASMTRVVSATRWRSRPTREKPSTTLASSRFSTGTRDSESSCVLYRCPPTSVATDDPPLDPARPEVRDMLADMDAQALTSLQRKFMGLDLDRARAVIYSTRVRDVLGLSLRSLIMVGDEPGL